MNAKAKTAQHQITPFMLGERLATIRALLKRPGLTGEQRERLTSLESLMVEEARMRATAPERARRLDTKIRWIERGAPVRPLAVG